MRAMCAAAAWISIPIAAAQPSHRKIAGWYASNEKPQPSAGVFLGAWALDPHIGQALHDIAQGAGQGRMADFETLHGQVDSVDQGGVRCGGGLVSQLQFDLL